MTDFSQFLLNLPQNLITGQGQRVGKQQVKISKINVTFAISCSLTSSNYHGFNLKALTRHH